MTENQYNEHNFERRVREGRELIERAASMLRTSAHDVEQYAAQYSNVSGGTLKEEMILSWVTNHLANILPNLRLDLFVSKVAEIAEAKTILQQKAPKEQPALSESKAEPNNASADVPTRTGMERVRSAVKDFRKVQQQHASAGARDSEPNHVFNDIVRRALQGRDFVLPRTGMDWQLYTTSVDCSKAADDLHLAALGVVQAIWSCPMKERKQLVEYFG